MSERLLADYTPDEVMAAVDTIATATRYLAHSWGIDTPPNLMQANLDARAILIKANLRLIDEAQALLLVTWSAR